MGLIVHITLVRSALGFLEVVRAVSGGVLTPARGTSLPLASQRPRR